MVPPIDMDMNKKRSFNLSTSDAIFALLWVVSFILVTILGGVLILTTV